MVALSGELRQIVDDLHFLLQRVDAVAADMMSQTLGWFDENTMFIEALKNQA